ncbi:hypothetical protein BD324DRAFT_461464 [Kockovaella imperatae]|uniref:Adipose-regulatory protein-domain-containing protein n=1 Tax=Kockovaella imperatae TaxID=4999 RepID=A0A1Y1UHY2_9TREE|nr:hypothetical protein BD324DRAFT_461464 [Kockovaella imperatae]ORX36695.1 hypothetical protein BD324DRAFT_461464 [Kockovaella imperatae]
MASQPEPSLEPYLRARAMQMSQGPGSGQTLSRDIGRQDSTKGKNEFLEFLVVLLRTLSLPVTLPLKWIHNILASPLTVSVVLKLLLLFVLLLGSSVFSILATGAFWYSWGTGGEVELEGWLIYGSKNMRAPHTTLDLPIERFQEELRYDVQVEMELVRPTRGSEEMGNFMLTLQLLSARDSDLVVFGAAQPSLPPPPLSVSLFALPSLPTHLLPPCIIPWPFRAFCPSRVLGYADESTRRIRRRRAKGSLGHPVGDKNVVLLRKNLMEGVVVNPGRARDTAVGSAFVSIGREDADTFDATAQQCQPQSREVRTTGWVVVRFTPRPTGVRWLLSVHPIPPLLILPPISLALTLSSSLIAFVLISFLFRPKAARSSRQTDPTGMSEADLLAEKASRLEERQAREASEEEARRRREWEEVESSALGGLRKMPEERKRTSTIGGSETTAPSRVRSFAPILDTETEVTETETEDPGASESAARSDGHSSSESDSWEEAR